MNRRLDGEVHRVHRRSRRRDETGTALVELALVLPLVMLLLGAAFDGWNAMQETIRLTSAARAGAIVAASDMKSNASCVSSPTGQAVQDATTAVNAEEDTSAFQSDNSSANNYVSLSGSSQAIPGGANPPTSPVTMCTVTVSISHASTSFIPFVGSFPVTTHATARYS